MQAELQLSQQSIKVLRRIKNAFKQAAEVQCRGCGKKLKPVIFKAHIMNCSSLFDDSESFREVAEGADFDQIYIKVLKYDHEAQMFVFNIKSSLNVNVNKKDGQ